jgi:hypothetical protein
MKTSKARSASNMIAEALLERVGRGSFHHHVNVAEGVVGRPEHQIANRAAKQERLTITTGQLAQQHGSRRFPLGVIRQEARDTPTKLGFKMRSGVFTHW